MCNIDYMYRDATPVPRQIHTHSASVYFIAIIILSLSLKY